PEGFGVVVGFWYVGCADYPLPGCLDPWWDRADDPTMSMNESLSEAQLDAMERRIMGATPGPWVPLLETRWATGGGSCIQVDPDAAGQDDEIYLRRFVDGREVLGPDRQLDADLDFIASAREDMPRLIAEVRRLRAAVPAQEV
ncbi:hypothetical protein, partial [Kitasatospora sp. NPDC093558]|uniref:hypothetical protein n=1 Tax=Kitasatospora sp. NPDC093558 TaxID=3155201 RepID=UPI003418A8BD